MSRTAAPKANGTAAEGGDIPVNAALHIAREEWRLLRRDRVAVLGLALLLLLTAVATLTSWEQRRATDAERTRYQAQVDHEFEAQPDRHPHRMVHFGHFVFRPLNPLAAFDPGVDAYTGHTLFLEGHRQNSANFADVRQSSLLLRFGQLTPAFVLQVLAPLLLIFVGHAALARERESGTLRVLLAQGVRPWEIVAGKLLALSGVAAAALLPALLALAWIGAATPAPASLSVAMATGYGLWLLIWVAGVVGVSAWSARGRDALVALLALWTVSVVLVPRLAPELAASALALPTRYETDIAVSRDLAALGDSHDPDDPYFAGFKKKVLAQYGVSRVEDLPVNYKGLLGMEGERLTSALFDRYANANFDRQAAQLRRVDAFALLSPVIALRRLSMAAAGTDLHNYRRFVEQAERHRYRLVQELNRLQAENLSFAGDRSSRDSRISHAHWHGVAEFRFGAASPIEAMRRALPAAGVLLLWLGVLAGLLVWATRHLGRVTR
jgi:ABC-2 type transport system permease protein